MEERSRSPCQHRTPPHPLAPCPWRLSPTATLILTTVKVEIGFLRFPSRRSALAPSSPPTRHDAHQRASCRRRPAEKGVRPMKCRSSIVRTIHHEDDPPYSKKKSTLKKRYPGLWRPPSTRFKAGDLNYYWTTGKITQDPNLLRDERGFEGLLKIIGEKP